MARETKVGLLAGLAFIVCFAVILTNKGQRDAARPEQIVTGATTARVTSRGDHLQPVEESARPNRPSGRITTPTNPPRSSQRPAGDRRTPEWQRPLPQAAQQQEPNPGREPSGSTLTYRVAGPSDSRAIRPAPTSLASRPPADAGQPVGSMSQSVPPRQSGTESTTRRRIDRPATEATAHPEPPPPAQKRHTVLARYTVVPGDTLTRIAARHYGAGSRQHVNALVDANRSVISDPNVLRAGMVLAIPSVGDSAAMPTRARSSPSVGDASPTSGRTAQFRWYQIEANDRYISIAREQLGDGNRWREIFELNKKEFPDPGRIRVGVRIKLPIDQAASAEGRR